MKEDKTVKRGFNEYSLMVHRALAFFMAVAMFFPTLNAARISETIDSKIALFTSAISYDSLINKAGLLLRMGTIDESMYIVDYIGAILIVLGIIAVGVSACMSLGSVPMQRVSALISLIGGGVTIVGGILEFVAYSIASGSIDSAKPVFPGASLTYIVMSVIIVLISLLMLFNLPKVTDDMKFEMDPKFKLFLMFLPFGLLAFLFCYLPLWGWRYAFFDYQAGGSLNSSNFVGFKWFTYLFQNEATRADVVRVIRNTLAMSGLGLAFSWLPMVFAIFLCEIKNLTFRRFVQTFTTVPNFISWVLVYALALSIFDTTGFINQLKVMLGIIDDASTQGVNYLMGNDFTWVKMWLWGTWKGIGWSAIIYIAGISGIDQQLYEAATVDGAGRFQKMWNITVPGLLPTFFVLLLMAVAAILSNGLDQYLVFENAQNYNSINVLDLYVYHLGLGSNGSIPLSTVVGMFKSLISVVLLFGANSLSKALRGESII